jgi:hypothetical protein
MSQFEHFPITRRFEFFDILTCVHITIHKVELLFIQHYMTVQFILSTYMHALVEKSVFLKSPKLQHVHPRY